MVPRWACGTCSWVHQRASPYLAPDSSYPRRTAADIDLMNSCYPHAASFSAEEELPTKTVR